MVIDVRWPFSSRLFFIKSIFVSAKYIAKLIGDVLMNRQNAANRSLRFIICTRTPFPLVDVLICDLFPDLKLCCNR